jgi:predicted Zn-dependent protease with MMP-like domain
MRRQRSLVRGGGGLYGLYEGIALPLRASGYDRVMPDRITIFWGPLVRDFPDDGTLESEVRKTVYHEIAHYFGLDEADLEHTSVR